MADSKPEISFCIPAYQAEGFIEETLRAVQAQSFPGFRVLVSIDKSTDATESICRSFEEDGRFEIYVQPEQLGWTGNVNFLLERVGTPFFCLLPHDDLLSPDYAERLLALVQGDPNCIVAYSAVELFGTNSGARSATDFVGSAFDRVTQFFLSGAEAIPLRGIVRSEALARGLRLKPNGYEGFANEVIWVLDLLTMGDCLALPEPLYRKRIRADSLIRKRLVWPREKRLGALAEHFRQCMESVSVIEASAGEERLLRAACLSSALWRLQLDRFNHEQPLVDLELLLLALACGGQGSEADQEAISSLIDGHHLKVLTARFRFGEGLRLMHGENWPAAEALFAESVALDPDFFNAHDRLVHCLARQKRHEAVVAAALVGAGRFAQDHQLLLAAARAELARGRPKAAETHLREALRRAPAFAAARELLGQIEGQGGKGDP